MKKPSPRRLSIVYGRPIRVAISALLLACVAVAYLGYRDARKELPTYAMLSDIRQMESSEVYSVDGTVIGQYYIQDRLPVAFGDIPTAAIQALVATEDIRFYDHRGIDWYSLPRVAIKTVLLGDRSAGGGSTITQQLAKNLYPRKNDRPWSLVRNKLREMLIARRLEELYTKNEILTLYFNTVSFGMRAHGLESASRRFFDKSCQSLDVQEAATLVGVLKATTYYNPIDHPERARARRDLVLRQMQKAGHLSPAECDSLTTLPLRITPNRRTANAGLAPYFRAEIEKEIEDLLDGLSRGMETPYNLYTDGLKIHTTIDATMQRYAEEAVSNHLSNLQRQFEKEWAGTRPPWRNAELIALELKKAGYRTSATGSALQNEHPQPVHQTREMSVFSWTGPEQKMLSPADSVSHHLKFLHAGFVAIEPQTGAVRAWVGGIDHNTFRYDHVHKSARRQVGSVFKPLVYATALEQGISPCEYIKAAQRTFEEDGRSWKPANTDRQYEGRYSMEGGLMHSVNTVSVKILEAAGIGRCISLARKMGIESDIPPYPSIALGTPSISLIEMTGAYTTFATNGLYNKPYAIRSIEDRHGNILWSREDSGGSQALKPETAIQIREMLRGVVDEGTAAGLRTKFGLRNDLAGKTGTTQNNADGWFIVTSPRLTVGAWVGASYPAIHFRSTALGQGASSALPLAGLFFKSLNKDGRYREITRAQFPPAPSHLLRELDCKPFKEDFRLFDWLFGKSKGDGRKATEEKKGGLFKKIGDLFKNKKKR